MAFFEKGLLYEVAEGNAYQDNAENDCDVEGNDVGDALELVTKSD